MVIKFGKWLTRHKAVVLIIAFLLLIPATIGYVSTRINYDLLSYLPNSLETVSGQDTMVDEFGMGAFSMVVVEDMEKKDIVALKEKLKKVNHVEDVIWTGSVSSQILQSILSHNTSRQGQGQRQQQQRSTVKYSQALANSLLNSL